MKHLTVKEKNSNAFEALKGTFGYKNPMSAPKLQKVVVNVGTGTMMKKDNKRNDQISDRLAKITGQKPAKRGAKKSRL
jgi:large subunit ribosomal protein L5